MLRHLSWGLLPGQVPTYGFFNGGGLKLKAGRAFGEHEEYRAKRRNTNRARVEFTGPAAEDSFKPDTSPRGLGKMI